MTDGSSFKSGDKQHCRAGHRYFDTFVCTKPIGHDDKHGYAGCFWEDAEATDPPGESEQQ